MRLNNVWLGRLGALLGVAAASFVAASAIATQIEELFDDSECLPISPCPDLSHYLLNNDVCPGSSESCGYCTQPQSQQDCNHKFNEVCFRTTYTEGASTCGAEKSCGTVDALGRCSGASLNGASCHRLTCLLGPG